MVEIDREKVINDLQDAVNDDWMWQHADYYAKAMENAIALLKEQEAKTVLNAGRQAVGNNKVFYGNCPNCQRRLYAKTSNYCQYCGQKVKWE